MDDPHDQKACDEQHRMTMCFLGEEKYQTGEDKKSN
jgi:hypothetical protein